MLHRTIFSAHVARINISLKSVHKFHIRPRLGDMMVAHNSPWCMELTLESTIPANNSRTNVAKRPHDCYD